MSILNLIKFVFRSKQNPQLGIIILRKISKISENSKIEFSVGKVSDFYSVYFFIFYSVLFFFLFLSSTLLSSVCSSLFFCSFSPDFLDSFISSPLRQTLSFGSAHFPAICQSPSITFVISMQVLKKL